MSTTNACRNGPGSNTDARSDPTKISRYTGSSSSCPIISNGDAASSFVDDAPARPLNTMT